MEKKPFISCKCITYGRVNLLEEAIKSFLIQSYSGKKELIIVNDYPKQNLIFNHPEVKIFNINKTFPTIGEKENFAVSKCSGELIAVWDDDDIALPNHLDNISKYMKNNSLLHWGRGILMDDGKITAITGLGNSGIVYTKKVWEDIGGHPLENAGYDMSFVMKIRSKYKFIEAKPEDKNVGWIYYWGNRSYHMSGLGTDTPDRDNIIKRHSEYIEKQVTLGNIPTGNIYLKPRWKRNYVKILEEFNK